MTESDERALRRREFLKGVGVAGVAATAMPLSVAGAQTQKAPEPMPGMAHAAANSNAQAPRVTFQFFNPDEASFIQSAVDTLIPSDETGPGALESGVAAYIDNQLAGRFGGGDRFYLEGPFGEGTPSQGYQLRLTPAELIRAGIIDTETYAQKAHGKLFGSLSPELRRQVFQEIEAGKAEFSVVPPKVFFNTLLQLTVEGYFGDPMYGGNRDKAAWRMIGFPGALGMYVDKIEEYRNKPFTADPVGIQDLS